MKKYILTLITLSFSIVLLAQTAKEKLKKDAEIMAAATLRQDFPALLSFMPPNVIAAGGGKTAILKVVQKSFLDMKAQGVAFKSIKMGEPGNIETIGKRQFALVPQTIEMKVEGGKLLAQGHNLAISEDKGVHWYYISAGNLKKETLYQFYPELKGKMEVPEQKEPIFTPMK